MDRNTKLVIFLLTLILSDGLCQTRPQQANKRITVVPGKCSLYVHKSGYDDYIDTEECIDSTKPLCGIDKTTGYGQGCVSASRCPPNVKDTGDIICDGSSQSCCCQDEDESYYDDMASDPTSSVCNNLLINQTWHEGCAKPELAQSTICTGPSPWLPVFCAKSEGENEDCPREKRYCGIDKNTGDPQGCVRASQCPGTVKDNGEIVCQAGNTSCCCLGKKTGSQNAGWQLACNNILKERGTSNNWKQACGLKELKDLPVCEKPTEPPFTEKCLAYCKTKKTRDVNGQFEINCRYGSVGGRGGGGGFQKRECGGVCPSECLCDDNGWKLKCPDIPSEPIKYRTDIETYVAIVLVGLIGLGIIAGIIYAIVMKTKKFKRKQVIGDPNALIRFYQNYPRPPGVVEMAQRDESLKAQESKAGTEGQPEAEK